MAGELLEFHIHAKTDAPIVAKSVSGVESLARPYRYEVEFASRSARLDFTEMLEATASLIIRRRMPPSASGKRQTGLLRTHGILSEFEYLGSGGGWFRFRAVLVPRLWRLGLNTQSRVFLKKNVKEILAEVLQGGKPHPLTEDDFNLTRLRRTYEPRPFTVQYRESDLDFFHRICEHEGISYYFEQMEDRERVVLTDLHGQYPVISGASVPFVDSAPGGADLPEAVHSLAVRQTVLPAEVVLNDYNYMTPADDLTVSAPVVSRAGFGQTYEFGGNYQDKKEGLVYAEIRAQELLCRQRLFAGTGTCRAFRAGRAFDLKQDDKITSFLITELRFRAEQEIELQERPGKYVNEFVAIPASAPFRPQRLTPLPKMAGLHYGKVHGSGSGDSAPIDEHGRYHISDPSLSSRPDDAGAPSLPIPRGQPYAGEDYGMHCPLHPGVDVVLGYIEGHPDRPIAMEAVPNPQKGSPVTAGNSTQCVLKTGAQSQMIFENQAGNERFRLEVPNGTTHFTMGSPDKDTPPGIACGTTHGVSINAGQSVCISACAPNHAAGTGEGAKRIANVTNIADAVSCVGGAAGSPMAAAVGALGNVSGILGGGGGGVAAPDASVTAPGNASLVGEAALILGSAAIGAVVGKQSNVMGLSSAVMIAGGTASVIAGKTVQVTANTGDVNITAKLAGSVAIVAKKSVTVTAETLDIALEARKKDIVLTAKTDVRIKAETGKGTITAKKELGLESKDAKKIVLKAGDSKIILTNDEITVTSKEIVLKTNDGKGVLKVTQKSGVCIDAKSKQNLAIKADSGTQIAGTEGLMLAATNSTVKITGETLDVRECPKIKRRHSEEA